MENQKYYTHDEVVELALGAKGTPARDMYEEEMAAFLVGDTIRKARQSQNLTQEELGAMVGVKKAQISRLERGGNNVTLSTISKVFRALGIQSACLDLGAAGRVALWG